MEEGNLSGYFSPREQITRRSRAVALALRAPVPSPTPRTTVVPEHRTFRQNRTPKISETKGPEILVGSLRGIREPRPNLG